MHAVIRGNTIPSAMQLPPAAILPADDGSTYILVVGNDGAAHKRAVKVGLRTADKVQIIDGVSANDMVITEGGYGLDDGTKVSLGSDKEKPGSAD